MESVFERCVVLKNLPPDCKESSVREVLDLAHGDWCFHDKYDILHKHIEFDDDVRWVVLFKSKADASKCIKLGEWESHIVRGGLHVVPDYCPGCIIPDEWREECCVGETTDWTNVTYSSEDDSFVKINTSGNYVSDTDIMEDRHCAVPTFGTDHENTFPQPDKELTNNLMETVHMKFNNNLETGDSDTESSDNLFCSGYKTKHSHRSTDQDGANPVKCTMSINGSDERWSSSELFGSGDRKENAKSKSGPHGEIKTYDKKEDISSVSSNELFGSDSRKDIDIDTQSGEIFCDESNTERKEKTESEIFSSDEKSDELFGSGSRKDNAAYIFSRKTFCDDYKKARKEKTENEILSDDGKSGKLFNSGNRKDKASDIPFKKTPYDDCKNKRNENTESERVSGDDKSEPVEVIDYQENVCNKTKDNSDTVIEENKKSWSVSVRSAELFGGGNENFKSMEFSFDLQKDLSVSPEKDTEVPFVEKEVESNIEEAETKPPKPAPRNLSNIKREPVNVESNVDDTETKAPTPAPRKVLNIKTEPVVTPEPETETYMIPTVPSQPSQVQQWQSYDYVHHMIQNFASYLPMPVNAQNRPLPQENMTANFMGNPMNPMYQMFYGNQIPNVIPEGMGQMGNQQASSGMAGPPVVYVPVYLPGPPPVDPAVKTDHLLDDRSGASVGDNKRIPTDESRSGFYSYQDDTTPERPSEGIDHKESYIYDVPYATVPSAAAVLQTECSKGVVKSKTSKRSNDFDFAESNISTYSDENIYDEIDENKLKSIRSVARRELSEGDATGTSDSSAQAAFKSARTGETQQVPMPQPKSNITARKTEKKFKRTEPKRVALNVYDDTETTEPSNGKDEIPESKQDTCRMVLVKGITSEMSKDALELFFENKRKSGGGEIESTMIDVKKGEAVIEFKNSEDAIEVIKKADSEEIFTLVGHELTVCKYEPPPMDPYKVFIRNIAETTTKECIINFLASRAKSEATDVSFGETPGTAMVCFDNPPDVTEIRKICENKRCEGNHWTVSAVELTRSVKVTGVNPQTSTDSLCLYFENKRRSDGGDVENVLCRHDDFIVTFFSAEDAERVCHRKHELGGQPLIVALHYPCLELDEDFIVQIPPPILLEEMDEYIVKFMFNSKPHKTEFESKLQDHYGIVTWPSKDSTDKNSVQITCSVDSKDKKGQAKVKNWTETCQSAVKDIIERLSVERSKSVAVEVWAELKERLRSIDVSHPEAIAVFLESSDCVVVIVGETLHVQDVSKQIDAIVAEIEEKLDSERQIITKKKKLRTYEMALVRASRLESFMKKIPVDFEICNEQKEIICKGKQKDVDDAFKKIDDTLKSFVKKPMPGMTKSATDLLFRKEARDYVKKKMNEKKVTGVWDVQRSSGLIMYSKNEKELNSAIGIVETSIVMDSFELDSEKKDILESNVGKSKVAEYEQNHTGLLHFDIQSNEFQFVCVDYLHGEIKDEFTKLFDLHSVISTFLQTGLGVFSYIVAYKKKEIQAIEAQYQRLSVNIEVKNSVRKPGFFVKGKKDGCKLAVNKLQAVIDSVTHKDHTLSWPGFDKFLQSTEGRDCIKNIEMSEQCVIKVSSETLTSDLGNSSREEAASLERNESVGRITKEVTTGSLAAENVDVIVNSTNKDLDLKIGAISRTLLKAGGDALAQECMTKYPDGIKLGEVAVTSSGNMKCNALFHGLLVKWDGGQGHAERVMADMVTCCLSLASRLKYSSIAFPALGTGALGFPADVVAQMMFDIVDSFERNNPRTSLKKVRFVIWSEDQITAKAFKDVEGRAIRRSSRVSQRSRQSYSYSPAAENVFIKGDGFSSTIGPVSVNIHQGDLTTLTSGAIVNSTVDDLNLNSGAISRAILAAAGDVIQNEALAKRRRFTAEGMVVTGPGKLMCQNIIHVRARNSMSGWAETIRRCLGISEQLGLTSVAFPALGTGGKGVPADRMARMMLDVFRDYVLSPDFQKCLKTIHVVIFDQKMLETFVTEAKSTLDPTKAARKSFLPEWKDLKFWEQKKPAIEPAPSVTMHIYAGSSYTVTCVVGKIDDIRREKDLFIPFHVKEHWEERHTNDLRKIGYTYGVKVVVDKSRVKVMGYGKEADSATRKAQVYIDNVEKYIKNGLIGSAVKLPTNWTKMKLSDPCTLVLLNQKDADYISVSRKFLQETGFATTNIVQIERVQNPTLFTQYIGKKTQMQIANKGGRNVEQILWHGTKSTAVNNINTKGFDRNYNSGSSHGVGVYFAVKALTSASGYCQADANGHKHIYMAHVLTGEYCVGRSGIRIPPPKPGSSETYDSTTDNVQNPNFYVIFHDAQAYPSYLITFR